MKQFEITSESAGQRLDKYLARILSNAGMSFIYKMLRKKNFVLNDKKATGKEIIKVNDIVKLYISDDTFDKFKANNKSIEKESYVISNNRDFDIAERVVYEDDDIIIVNKPEGMLSQKASSSDMSINEYILSYLIDNKSISDENLVNYKPSVVNRLDRNTTGLIIAAKNLKAAQYLSKIIKDRAIKKYYKCIVCGDFNKSGVYKAYLTKDKATNVVKITDKPIDSSSEYIETSYDIIEHNEETSILKVELITGKSHQIRAHLSYLGFPILGDRKYGNTTFNKRYKANNQMLHAYRLEFPKDNIDSSFKFLNKIVECEPDFRY